MAVASCAYTFWAGGLPIPYQQHRFLSPKLSDLKNDLTRFQRPQKKDENGWSSQYFRPQVLYRLFRFLLASPWQMLLVVWQDARIPVPGSLVQLLDLRMPVSGYRPQSCTCSCFFLRTCPKDFRVISTQQVRLSSLILSPLLLGFNFAHDWWHRWGSEIFKNSSFYFGSVYVPLRLWK